MCEERKKLSPASKIRAITIASMMAMIFGINRSSLDVNGFNKMAINVAKASGTKISRNTLKIKTEMIRPRSMMGALIKKG